MLSFSTKNKTYVLLKQKQFFQVSKLNLMLGRILRLLRFNEHEIQLTHKEKLFWLEK